MSGLLNVSFRSARRKLAKILQFIQTLLKVKSVMRTPPRIRPVRKDIVAHSCDELERRLTELKKEQEGLARKYDVNSLDEFRKQLADGDLLSKELREHRNVIAT